MNRQENLTEKQRNNKKFGAQWLYLLDCINSDEKELNTDREKVEYLFKCFEEEFNHPYNKKRYPNTQKRVGEWLSGLPSCIGIDFMNYRIIEVGKSWGYCGTEKKEDAFINNWFNMCAFRLLQLAKIFNIEVN